MSVKSLELAHADPASALFGESANDGTILRRRIAGLTRTLEERDRTICDLVRQREQASRSDMSRATSTERSSALRCALCSKTTEFETIASQLKAATARLHKAEKMVSIGQLAAGIAHELNTPIQYVSDNVMFLEHAFDVVFRALDKSRADAAMRGAVPVTSDRDGEKSELDVVRDDLPDALEQSRDGLRRIAAIVTAMKNFSHPSDDVMAPADLVDIIETTLAVSRSEWKYVADVETRFAADLGMVPCIRDDIEKVVLNLVVNAAHAIRSANENKPGLKGNIFVTTRLAGEFAEILIADTGSGISDAIKHRVFDPFFTTKPVGVGTGQGLAIARTCIVERHRGELFFETELGKGTTFHVRIPVHALPDAQ